MGLHAQAFAAMPLPPALAEIMNDLLDEERPELFELTQVDDRVAFAASEAPVGSCGDPAANAEQR